MTKFAAAHLPLIWRVTCALTCVTCALTCLCGPGGFVEQLDMNQPELEPNQGEQTEPVAPIERTRRLSGRAVITIVVATVVAIVALTTVGSYAAASADCTDCHKSVSTQVEHSSHADLECATCHVSPTMLGRTRFGATLLFGMAVHVVDTTRAPALNVPNSRCTSCHDDLAGTAGNTLKIDHEACAPYDQCVKCHTNVGHDTEKSISEALDMFDCLSCHNKTQQTQDCDSCHAGRLPEDRIKTGSFAVTHGPDWQKTHGMGNMSACSACHTADKCAKCHGTGVPHTYSFQRVHGSYGKSAGAQCATCHTTAYCQDCHGIEMPHPAGFKETHSDTVKADGQDLCMTCHIQSDCTTCHTMHIHPGGSVGKGDGL